MDIWPFISCTYPAGYPSSKRPIFSRIEIFLLSDLIWNFFLSGVCSPQSTPARLSKTNMKDLMRDLLACVPVDKMRSECRALDRITLCTWMTWRGSSSPWFRSPAWGGGLAAGQQATGCSLAWGNRDCRTHFFCLLTWPTII